MQYMAKGLKLCKIQPLLSEISMKLWKSTLSKGLIKVKIQTKEIRVTNLYKYCLKSSLLMNKLQLCCNWLWKSLLIYPFPHFHLHL